MQENTYRKKIITMDQPHTPKKDTFQVKQYTIGAKDILGHGAFGVVYRAKDFEGKHLAAKTIDGKRHPKIWTKIFIQFFT